MPSPAEDRLMGLWLKIAASGNSVEAEPLLWEFRTALHEHLDQCRAEAKKQPSVSAMAS
jgi:hypothetical protein